MTCWFFVEVVEGLTEQIGEFFDAIIRLPQAKNQVVVVRGASAARNERFWKRHEHMCA